MERSHVEPARRLGSLSPRERPTAPPSPAGLLLCWSNNQGILPRNSPHALRGVRPRRGRQVDCLPSQNRDHNADLTRRLDACTPNLQSIGQAKPLGSDPCEQNAGVVFMYIALGSCGTLRGEDPFNPNRLAICPAGTGQGQAQTPLSPAGFSIQSGQTPMPTSDLNRIQPCRPRPQQAPEIASEPPDASGRVSAPESPQRPPGGP
jgi:hypothetical protein